MKRKLTLLVLLFLAVSVSAKTWTVKPSSGEGVDFTSINEALVSNEVVDGDIINVSGNFEITASIDLTKAVEIVGDGTATTEIKAMNGIRAFVSYGKGKDFKLKNMTVTAAATSAEPGVGLFVYDVNDFSIDNVNFKGLTGSNGGAILINTVRKFSISNCEFINNSGTGVGGALYLTTLGGQGIIENCTFEGNLAPNNGWGNAIILDNGSAPQDELIIRNCTFYKNGAALGGVIAYNYANIKLSIHACTFANNEGNDNVGDLYYIPNAGSPGLISFKGNLFYNSRGIVLPDEYADDLDVKYNASTSPINIVEGLGGYEPLDNMAELIIGEDVLLETNDSYPVLKNNGGVVRTIKLEGTPSSNMAISFVPEALSTTDARGYARKATEQDCGAYDTQATGSGINENFLENRVVNFYPNPATDVINFTEPISGVIKVIDISGRLLINERVDTQSHLNISSLISGIYYISINTDEGGSSCQKLIVR